MQNAEIDFARLFPEGPYRFHVGIMKREVPDYFLHSSNHDAVLSERSRLLSESAEKYACMLTDCEPLLNETIDLAYNSGSLTTEQLQRIKGQPNPQLKLKQLGSEWEPDFCLLQKGKGDDFILKGGCICFPSSWSLEEKIGQPLNIIHEPVTGLNAQIGANIQTIMCRTREGSAWDRISWGLSRSDDLNQHPSMQLPRLDGSINLQEAFLRVENTALVALPETQSILFAIRVNHLRLSSLHQFPVGHAGLLKALRTMPKDIAEYKGIEPARNRLIELLSS
jgi:hypothetical protein